MYGIQNLGVAILPLAYNAHGCPSMSVSCRRSIRGHVLHITSALRRELAPKGGRLRGFGADKREEGGPNLSRRHMYNAP